MRETGLSKSFRKALPQGVLRVALLMVVLVSLFLMVGASGLMGPDYFFTFRPVAEAYLRGQTRLFDAKSLGYFAAPWGLLLLAPTLVLSPTYGQALLTVTSAAGLVFSVYAILSPTGDTRPPMPMVILGMLNLHTFDLLIRGNLDAFLAVGLGLGWMGLVRQRPYLFGAGLWLLSIKPPNVLLPILVMLCAARKWPRNDQVKAGAPVVLTFLLSLALFGVDWPIRYVKALAVNPPFTYLQTSVWRVFEYFGMDGHLAVWPAALLLGAFLSTLLLARPPFDVRTLALAIGTNLTVSPYTLGSHYVLLAPVFVLLTRRWPWMALSWLLTLTPLLRLRWGFAISWIDLLYPTTLMIATFLLVARGPKTQPLDARAHEVAGGS